MKLFDTLKQFKTIEPDAQYTAHSRAEILLSPQPRHRAVRGVYAFLRVLETSAAVVLAGLFILVLTGSFSPAPAVSPIQYSVIDPAGLHAEAQAIDMQIQLADVEYPQATSSAASGSTPATGTPLKAMSFMAPAASTATSSAVQSSSATSTSSSSLSIDQALTQLSQ